MAVRIRLRRDGAKGRPYYRIVVADGRARKEGPFIEIIGTYDPMKSGAENYTLDLDKTDQWISNGALPTETVSSLIRKARKASAPAS